MTTITAVFVLFLALPAAVVKSCKYPDFVQNNPKDKQDFWATRIQYGVPKEILRVSGGIVKGYAQPANGTAPSITVTCRQQVGNATRAKYITVVERRNRAKVYVCVQILRRTPDILQLKLGPFKNTSNISLCDDSLMTIYGNLLVANKKKDRSWQFCGLQGGFYFTGKTGDDVPGQSMKDLCPMSIFPSRVDAECLKGEGIRFAFPHEECIPPATGWSRDQTIQCSGTWIEGNNRFSVLNSPKGLYCMKYPSKNQRGGDQFTAYIYPYLTCPTGEPAPGTPVIQLNMTQSDTIGCQDDIDRNICKEKKKLGLCSSSLFATYCRLSCGICASDCFDKWGATLCKILKDVHLCKFVGSHGCMKTCGLCESKSSFNLSDEKGPAFMRSLRGKWLAPLGEKVRHNQISARTFTVEDFGSFRLNSSLDSLSYVLRQTPGETRGCLPRYLCAKFNRKTKPVLSYKLSQSVITFKDKRDVCESSQFRDDPQPLGETFRSKYMKNLISANPRWLNETTLCGFGGNFTFNMTIQSPGSKIKRTCTGNFTDNQNCKDLKSIESNIACQGGFIGHYNSLCLARWRSTSNSSRFLITAIPQQSSHATCLIIPDKGKDAYVMPAALCNEEVERYVITGKTKPLARITIVKEYDQCDHPSTVTSPPAPTTSSNLTTTSGNYTSTAHTGTTPTRNYTSTAHTGTTSTRNYTSTAHTGTTPTRNYTSTAHTGTTSTRNYTSTAHTGTTSTRNYTSTVHTKSPPTGSVSPFTGTTSNTTRHPLTTAVPARKGLTPGQIAGIVIGVLLAIVVIAIIIFIIIKKCGPRSEGYENM